MCHNVFKDCPPQNLLSPLLNTLSQICHDISTTIMNEVFTLGHQFRYNLRNWTDFDVPKVKTVGHGSESVRYVAPKIWEIIPTHIKGLNTIDRFKIASKKWEARSCPCRLYKIYLQNIDYIQT